MWLKLFTATQETLLMVLISGALATLIGFWMGVTLFYTRAHHPWSHKITHTCLTFLVNTTRSFPFIILMIALVPLTRLLVGTSIGTWATIPPLTLAAIPVYARLTESALQELPKGLFELAHTVGASPLQTVRYILFPEARPALISGVTLMLIHLVGYSAMAGVIGGGGLGSLAFHEGYQRFDTATLTATIIILVFLVQAIQYIGHFCTKQYLKTNTWEK